MSKEKYIRLYFDKVLLVYCISTYKFIQKSDVMLYNEIKLNLLLNWLLLINYNLDLTMDQSLRESQIRSTNWDGSHGSVL